MLVRLLLSIFAVVMCAGPLVAQPFNATLPPMDNASLSHPDPGVGRTSHCHRRGGLCSRGAAKCVRTVASFGMHYATWCGTSRYMFTANATFDG